MKKIITIVVALIGISLTNSLLVANSYDRSEKGFETGVTVIEVGPIKVGASVHGKVYSRSESGYGRPQVVVHQPPQRRSCGPPMVQMPRKRRSCGPPMVQMPRSTGGQVIIVNQSRSHPGYYDGTDRPRYRARPQGQPDYIPYGVHPRR
jgi:hypothetical protein